MHSQISPRWYQKCAKEVKIGRTGVGDLIAIVRSGCMTNLNKSLVSSLSSSHSDKVDCEPARLEPRDNDRLSYV